MRSHSLFSQGWGCPVQGPPVTCDPSSKDELRGPRGLFFEAVSSLLQEVSKLVTQNAQIIFFLNSSQSIYSHSSSSVFCHEVRPGSSSGKPRPWREGRALRLQSLEAGCLGFYLPMSLPPPLKEHKDRVVYQRGCSHLEA